jgi:hypothetical protein
LYGKSNLTSLSSLSLVVESLSLVVESLSLVVESLSLVVKSLFACRKINQRNIISIEDLLLSNQRYPVEALFL